MKVLDVSSLQEGIREVTRTMSQLEKQLYSVENAIQSFITSKDSFRGKGANAIRRYYEYAHLPLLIFFQLFLVNFQTKIQQLQMELDSLEGDSRGFIDEAFLTREIEDGVNQINRMVSELTEETNAKLRSVDDIVYLPRLKDHHFHDGVQQAKKSARETADKLQQFDHQQTRSFTAFAEDLSLITNYIEEMTHQFQSGKINVKSFSPVLLKDLEAYGKLQTRLYNQTVMQRWNSEHYPDLGVFYSVGHPVAFDQWVNPSCARPERNESDGEISSFWKKMISSGNLHVTALGLAGAINKNMLDKVNYRMYQKEGKTYIQIKTDETDYFKKKTLLTDTFGSNIGNNKGRYFDKLANSGIPVYNDNVKGGGFLKNRYHFSNTKIDHLNDYITRIDYDTSGKMWTSGVKDFKHNLKVWDDFTGWKGASKYVKFAKSAGVVGNVFMVGSNVNKAMDETGKADQTRRFIVDTGVDLGTGAGSMAAGAAVGSLLLPPLGTVVGAGVGVGINFAINYEFGDPPESLVGKTKNFINDKLDPVGDAIGNAVSSASDLVDGIGKKLGSVFW